MSIDFAIDPVSEDFRTHSADYYRRLQAERPVARTTKDQWLFCRHEDVRTILTDHDRFQRPTEWSVNRKPEGPLRDFGRNNMVGMNPPLHTRFRQNAARGFSRRQVQDMAPRIEALVDRLIDRMIDEDGGDFITAFAFPLPVFVICDMLGIPPDDFDLFGRLTADMLASLEMAATAETFAAGADAAAQLFEYCKAVAAERETQPADDLISVLIGKEQTDRMTRDEVIWTAVTLLIAGHETTTHMLGNGMLALTRHPDQLAELVANPDLSAAATEEILRFDPTLYVVFRETREDTTVGGQALDAGSFLIASLYAANHDPQVFDDPKRFDIRRRNADEHLTFAAGRHLCLGHFLARLEGRIAFARLVQRLRDFELAGEPTPRNGLMFKGNLSLPMRWRAA